MEFKIQNQSNICLMIVLLSYYTPALYMSHPLIVKHVVETKIVIYLTFILWGEVVLETQRRWFPADLVEQ